MSRRKPKRAPVAVSYDKPWFDGLLELFDLVGDGWTPPDRVRIRKTARTMTVTARFQTPAGIKFTAQARIAQYGDGWVQTEESLGSTFTMKATQP